MTVHDPAPRGRLMISGELPANGAKLTANLQRGLVVLDSAGEDAGRVAAVLVDGETGTVTHLVIARDTGAGDYRLAPAEQIAGFDIGAVRLRLAAGEVAALPRHDPD